MKMVDFPEGKCVLVVSYYKTVNFLTIQCSALYDF